MKKYLFLLVIFVYILSGIIIEEYGLIKHPAPWALYGFFFGMLYVVIYERYNA